jgi:phosphatidylglycerol lysyltransferase
MRRRLLLLLAVVLLWLVVARFAELHELRRVVAQFKWNWMLAAVACQITYFGLLAASYRAAFATLGVSTRHRDLVPLVLGSLFVSVVMPAGGAGGTALFTEDLIRRGKPGARAATGVLLQLIADSTAFSLLLISGIFVLFIEGGPKAYEVGAVAILFLLTASLSGLLWLAMARPLWLHRLFVASQRTADWLFGRFKRSLTLAEDWAGKDAEGFNQAAAAVARHRLRLAETVALALLGHLAEVATLYLLFVAFDFPIKAGPLIVGYAVGMLFWIVSVTPQGIGVVEAATALAFISMGIPGTVAAIVAVVFRGLSFWMPMLLGFIAVQRIRGIGPNRRTLAETWGVRFAAILVALMGIVNVISAATPALAGRLALLEKYSPLEVRHGGHLTAALAGFALLMLARNLARRKRVAWVLTLVVLGVTILGDLIKSLAYEEALLAGAVATMLWLMRDHFHARSDPPSIQQGLRVLLGALIFTLAYGVTGFFLLDRHYSVNFRFWAAVRQTVVMFTQFYDPGLVPLTRFGRFFASSIYIVGATTLSYAGLMLLRPVFVREPAKPEERTRARSIVERYGHSSVARFLLLDDKRYLFTDGGSVIGFALAGRTAVALGDPIGPVEDRRASIGAFKAHCLANDWLPVFYQTLPEALSLYRQAGFDTVRVGVEGLVDLSSFTLEGNINKPLRVPFNRLVNLGHTFRVHDPPIPAELVAELRTISDEWLTTVQGSEKKFSLGWFDDDYVRESPIGAVYTRGGWISAFATLLSEYQANEIAIDLMRRRNETENGTMEFLFVSLIRWAKEHGYARFDLGLSALSGVGERPGDPAIERLLHVVYEHVNQFYNFKGLHSFKGKFHPEWSPRYLAYPGASSLAQAWLAVVQVHLGTGTYPWSSLKRRQS